MIALIVGLVVGFLMCIPIGPINVWVINLMVKKGRSNALALAGGGSLMDFVYFVVIMTGLSFFSFSSTNTFYLKVVGVALILILGIKELMSKVDTVKSVKIDNSAKDLFAAFVLGIVIYTSNPTLIVTMTGLGTFIKSMTLFPASLLNNLLLSLGLAAGSFGWFVFLTFVVGKYQEKIRNKYLNKFNKVSGVLMIVLAVFMAYKLYSQGNLV